MSPRKFNIICIATLVAVIAVAMVIIFIGPAGSEVQLPPQAVGAGSEGTNAYAIQPLSLGLSLTVLADMSLMTAGLIILFKDDGPRRYRAR